MAEYYRRFLMPTTGSPAPEAMIDEPQAIDFDNIQVWRHKNNLETIAKLTSLYKPCFCYEPLMSIRTTNVMLEPEGRQLPIRVYLPEGEGPFPVMVFYHGGAWSMNNLDVYDHLPRYFAKFGRILVVTPEYRLAPEHPFPQGLEDAYTALEWAFEQSGDMGGDPYDITVCGDSSGGNFATVVSAMSRDRKGPAIKRQILLYAAVCLKMQYRPESELRFGNGGYFLDMNTVDGLCPWYVEKEEDLLHPYVSPLLASNLSSLPPASFFCGDCDPLLDQNLMYAAKLEDAGNQVDFSVIPGMIHAYLNRPYQKTFETFNAIINKIHY